MKKIYLIIIVVIIFMLGSFYLLNTYIYNKKQAEMVSVKLYYYNPSLDQGVGGVQCSEKGLQEVSRKMPKTLTPLHDSIKLLIEGDLTPLEKSQGITTEFPLLGFELLSAQIDNGVATLTFSDPNNKTEGGSCRTAILWNQIRQTAKQFETVKEVRFLPEELFQP